MIRSFSRRYRKDGSAALRTPAGGRAVERAINVDEACLREFAALASEAVKHGFLLGRRDREDGSGVVSASLVGRAVERAVHVDETRVRVSAVSRAAFEAVDHGFLTGRRDLEDRSVAACSAVLGRAIERALDVDQACIWELAGSRAAAEAVEHGFLAGRSDCEDRSGAVCATVLGRAVERAIHVEEAN